MTWWKNRSYRHDSARHRQRSWATETCGHQWAFWRRSGEDRRIKRTETWEGVLCERWDSRRSSIRRFALYRGRIEESTKETGKGCKDWMVWSNIYAVWPALDKGSETLPEGSSSEWITPISNRFCPVRYAGCSKSSSSKAAGDSKPEAYPLGRTVRRIRSTKLVRAAEGWRRPGPR
jgi:hypothetical protein